MKKYIKYWFWGVIMSLISFTSIAQTPILETYQPSNITGTSANLNGKVKKSPDGALLIARGFAIKTATNGSFNYYSVSSTDSIITFAATGLMMNTRYQFAVIALTMDSMYIGDTIGFNTLNPNITPQIVTSEVTNLTSTSAILNGNLVNSGNPSITEKGFLFSNNSNLTFATAQETIPIAGNAVGSFSYSKTELLSNNTYYFRAYAINRDTIILGSIISFTTPSTGVILPELTTSTPIVIDEHNASLSGDITLQGNQTITSIGFDVRKYSDLGFTTHIITPITDNFILNLNNLEPSTTYICRAFATTAIGTSYGETKSFVTEDEPYIFETHNPTNITANSAKLNGYIFNSTIFLQAFGFAVKEGSGDFSFYDVSSNYTLPCSIEYTISNLLPYQDYIYKVYGIGINDIYYGEEVTFKTNSIPSVVRTNSATELTTSGAKLNGRLSNAGIPSITQKGFIYSNSSYPTFENGTKINVNGINLDAYHYTLSNLNQNSQYYYRSFAISPIDTTYGAIVSFTTLIPGVDPPILTTIDATNITYNTAQISGTIYGGNQTISTIGFEYKSENSFDYITIIITGSTSIQTTLTNLAPNTTYEYHVFAISNNGSIYYGDDLEFTTPSIPMILTTLPASDITYNSATINGNIYDGTEIVLFRGFEWKLSLDTTYERVFITENNVSDLNYNLTNLQANKEYTYRVFSKTNQDFFFGNEISFFTKEITNPTISIVEASNIDTNSATFTGTIEEGSLPIIYRAFLIKKWGEENFTSYNLNNNNNLNITIDTLLEGTTYYVALLALTINGVEMGEISTIKTLGTHNIGLNDIDKNNINISLFPNPANDIITIDFDGSSEYGKINMIISDIQGRNIETKQITNNQTTYNISHLAKGVYTITFTSDIIKQTRKLIVK